MDHNNTINTNKEGPQIIMREIPGNTIYARRANPYGYLYISMAEGEVPDKYQGAYTGLDQVSLAIEHLIQDIQNHIPSEPSRRASNIVPKETLKKKALSA